MKAKRHTPNQFIRKLREAERMLGEGKTTAEVAKALEVSEVTFHRWRAQPRLRPFRRAGQQAARRGRERAAARAPDPHSLRRTYASLVVANGEDPTYVMEQLGHSDPKLTLRI